MKPAPAAVKPQPCPICFKPISFNPRYPRAVCPDCVSRAADESGRTIEFFNEDLSGGLIAAYRGTGEPYPSDLCWIDHIPCQAQEAHLGGIIIQPIQ